MLKVGVANGHPEHEEEDYNQRRVNPLDPAVVEVKVREFVFDIFIDKDLCDEISRDHEEQIHSDKSTR